MSNIAQPIRPQDSLVKYATARLMDKKDKPVAIKASATGSVPSTEELLHKIVPVKQFKTDTREWAQEISSDPATRLDVIALQEQLDLRLQQKHARETGICPVREELYAQCFDEIIRQVAVNCAERGVLLLRVRDEIRMTLSSLQSLYESSVAFGMRKALMAEQHKAELRARIRILTAEVADLEKSAESLKTRMAEMETTEKERFAIDEEKHQAEVAKLRAVNDGLKEQLDSLLAPPGK